MSLVLLARYPAPALPLFQGPGRQVLSSSYDELNIFQEIELSSQSSKEWAIKKSPDMFCSQEEVVAL